MFQYYILLSKVTGMTYSFEITKFTRSLKRTFKHVDVYLHTYQNT